jgi:hypothetical protein
MQSTQQHVWGIHKLLQRFLVVKNALMLCSWKCRQILFLMVKHVGLYSSFFFFFSLFSSKNHRVFFIVNILISILILLIFNFNFWSFCKSINYFLFCVITSFFQFHTLVFDLLGLGVIVFAYIIFSI